MDYKKWYRIFLFSVLASLVISAIINLVVDPFGVWLLLDVQGFNTIKKHIRYDALVSIFHTHKSKPINVVLGSSCVGELDPSPIAKYVEGPIYNLWLAGPDIMTLKDTLNQMNSKYTLKTLVLGIDFLSFKPITGEGKSKRDLTFKDRVGIIFSTLFSYQALERSYYTLRDNMSADNITGSESREPVELRTPKRVLTPERIKRELEQVFIPNYAKSPEFKDPNSIEDGLLHLKEIVRICSSNSIKLYLFVTPIYSAHFDLIYDQGLGNTFERLLKEVANITDFYDFSGYNSITMKPIWWKDTTHMIPAAGRLVYGRIFNDNSEEIPKDFGFLVTKANVDHYLNVLISNRNQARNLLLSKQTISR